MEKPKFLLKNRIFFHRILAAIFITAYVSLFCVLSFIYPFDSLGADVDDLLLQRGADFPDTVAVIGITADDLEFYKTEACAIAATVALRLNSDSETAPAVIGIDVPMTSISGSAKGNLLKAAYTQRNIVIPVQMTVDDSCSIGAFDNSEYGISAEVVSKPESDIAGVCRLGHSAKILDRNGILRHAVFDITAKDGTVYASMADVCYELYCSKNNIQPELPKLSKQNTAIVRFAESSAVEPKCSAMDLLCGNYDASEFAGKIVYIGCCNTGFDDGYLTAVDHHTVMHTAEVDANITGALLTGNFALSAPAFYQISALILTILSIIYLVVNTGTFPVIFSCVLYVLVERILAMLLYGVGYEFSSLPHILNAILTSAVFVLISIAIENLRKRETLEKALMSYVDENIARKIISETTNLKTVKNNALKSTHPANDSAVQKVAVLFADIRNFTSISEKISPEQIVEILNDYLSMMSGCIDRHGGTVDKFIGDCVMGYWGAPVEDENATYHACLAAYEMQRRVAEMSEPTLKKYGVEIQIGIGVNYGDAVVGNIGSDNRVNFTVIGDCVNTASRLENVAPGGAIYLSDAALERLGNSAVVESLPDAVKLRGKEKPIAVYSLKEISTHEVHSHGNSAIKHVSTVTYRSRELYALYINLINTIVLFIYVLNAIREHGMEFLSYFTVILSAMVCFASAMLVPYDIRKFHRADGNENYPRRLNNLMLIGVTSGIISMVLYICVFFQWETLGEYYGNNWLHSALPHIVCPLLMLVSFFVLEPKAKYKAADVLIATLPITALRAIVTFCTEKIGLSGLSQKTGLNFSELFTTAIMAITAIIVQVLLLIAYNKLNLNKKIMSKKQSGSGNKVSWLSDIRKNRLIKSRRIRHWVALLANVIIGILSIRATFSAYSDGGIGIYANPSLIGIIELILCVISVLFYADALIRDCSLSNRYSYKYVSFVRMFGCQINFFSVMTLAISGEGLAALITPRWHTDFTVFIICPIISLILWLSERNEYKLWKCILSASPLLMLPVLSKAAIFSAGLSAEYAYEIENFYNTQKIIATILAEFACVVFFYFVSVILARLMRSSETLLPLTVCGSRSGTSARGVSNSEYGLRSDCYVLRDNEYAIVINAGSGLANAKKSLSGCTKVDILLTCASFASLMGFLETPDICPGANVRIYAPFDITSFSVKPFWPVNLLLKYRHIVVSENKKYRLGGGYNVIFAPLDTTGRSWMLKISGTASIGYIGKGTFSSVTAREFATGCDTLIYNGYNENNVNACYLAIDCEIPSLLVTGYPEECTDESINKVRKKAEAILPEVIFAHESEIYPVRRN